MRGRLRAFGLAGAALALASGGLVAYRLAVPPQVPFSLVVLDERGQPVGFARVSVLSNHAVLGLERTSAVEGETGFDGRVVFEAVDAGTLHVQIEKAGFDDYDVSYTLAGEAASEVRLRRAPRSDVPKGIEVRVADGSGAPVARAVVVASGERKGRAFNFQSETDERGRALFPFVTPGLIDLSIRKTGFANYDLTHVVREDDRLDVGLVP